MSAYASKYMFGLDGKGYIISQNKNGVRYYQKKKAPAFVNKYGGGDVAYRDATFWQYFVQTNWRNGSKQLKFDDPGKFWKSSDVDTTILEELTLSKAFSSAGQLASGVKVNTIEAWRTDASSAEFGSGGGGALSIAADATFSPIDSSASGTAGSTSLTATNVSFAAGQKVLIHQTRGTGVGQYERRTISSYTAGTITLTEPLTYTYTTSGNSAAQVLVLTQYTDGTISSTKTLAAKPWDGTVGGIVAFLCSGTLTVSGIISASGYGYRLGATRGEPIAYAGEGTVGATVIQNAANGTGGGGGNGSVGGGGGNGAAGGGSNGGTTSGNAALTNMTFGGGGGGGSAGNPSTDGGTGGGIVFIYAKTIVGTGSITATGTAGGSGATGRGGGGGAGGSILLKGQTISGVTLTATGGAGGVCDEGTGGAGGTGRCYVYYSNSVSLGGSNPTAGSAQDSSLVDTPASLTSTAYAGASNGKIYSWDGGTTWTEVYDARYLTKFDTGTDTSFKVGDDGGTEKACSQGFQIATTGKVKGVDVYIKASEGTPGDITVRIETDNTNKPSGTLANANATATIPAFTSTSYGWVRVEFGTNFSLTASTTYHVVLKTAAAGNDNNYEWAGKTTSGYTGGANSTSTDGGTTWSAGTSDAYFRLLANTTSVNCALVTKVGGTKKLLFGTGDPDGTENGDARIISFDGTTWAINKTFTTTTESVVNSMTEYSSNNTVYVGVGAQARIYSSTDLSTYTLAKDVDVPQNPGYVYALKEYNRVLHAGGGSPELIPGQNYNGFLNIYDTTQWNILYPFDFTVIKSLEFYDAYLFMGTYHGHLYVYDTSTLNPLFNFKDQYNYKTTVYAMKYFDDKLYMGLYPQTGSADTNSGIWLFDRRGLTQAHTISGVSGYRCFAVMNGDLLVGTGDNGYVYKLEETVYSASGWYQSSYFDANLPSIDKLYNTITVRHDPLASGQSITVYYRFKEADSWSTLGLSNTVGDTEEILSFPTGTYSKKISLKVELATTDTSASPKLTEVIMQYSLYPQRKFQWTMRIKAKKNLRLLDNTLEPRSAEEIRQDIENLFSTQQLYTFVDVDSSVHSVLMNDLDTQSWVINSSETVNEEEVAITLLEA